MEVDSEQENLFRLFSLVNESIVPQLRKFFLEVWERQFPANSWCDSSDNRNDLLKMIIGGRRDALVKDRILKEKVDDWDFTCVSKALSALDINELETTCIDKLRNARNKISHLSSGKVSDKEKDEIFTEVNNVYDALAWPKGAVKKFEYERLTTEYVKQLKAKLDDERRAGNFEEYFVTYSIRFLLLYNV